MQRHTPNDYLTMSMNKFFVNKIEFLFKFLQGFRLIYKLQIHSTFSIEGLLHECSDRSKSVHMTHKFNMDINLFFVN